MSTTSLAAWLVIGAASLGVAWIVSGSMPAIAALLAAAGVGAALLAAFFWRGER